MRANTARNQGLQDRRPLQVGTAGFRNGVLAETGGLEVSTSACRSLEVTTSSARANTLIQP